MVDGGLPIHVPADRLTDGAVAVKVGVRPEKIRLEREAGDPPAGWNAVTGLLRMAAFIGVSHQYTVEGPGGRELTVYVQNVGADSPPHPGERVRLLWRPEHTLVATPDAAPAGAKEGEEES